MAGRFSVDAVFRAVDRFTRPIARMGSSVDRFSGRMRRSLGRASEGASQLSSQLSMVAGTVARVGAAVGAAGTAAAYTVGKTGADFEQAITDVGAVMLKTRDKIADLESHALKLGERTKFTATQSANAMEVMARAGFSNKQIMEGVGGVLNAAAASGLEMAEVAGHVSNVLKGMGKSSEDAAKAAENMGLKGAAAAAMTRKLTMDAGQASRVADVLALASSKTNSTIGTLGESMRNVSQVAKTLNIPLEQVVAAVASLQDVGLDASVAGSATATMLTKLSNPTDALKAKMKEMSVSFQNANGDMLEFPVVLQNLAKAALKSGGNMKQMAFFSDLVGQRGQKAAIALQDLARRGKLEPLVEKLEAAAGVSEKMAAIRMNTLQGDVTLLGSAIDSVKVALFNTESGPLRGVVQGTTEWVKANKNLVVSKFTDFMANVRRNLPEIVTWLKRAAVGVGVFVGLMVAVKVFQVAVAATQITLAVFQGVMWLVTLTTRGSEIATWAATVAHRARNIAVAIGAIGMKRLTLATLADTVKTALNTVAQWAKATAQAAVNLAVKTGRGILMLYVALTSAATLKDKAAIIALWAKAVAQGAVNLAVRGYNRIAGTCAALTSGVGTAAGGAATGMSAFAVTVASAAAAVGALYLAFKQLQTLESETEGLGFVGLLKQMWKQGTLDPAEALKSYQDMEAIERKAQANVNARARRRAQYASEQWGAQTGRGTRWVETAEGLAPKVAADAAKFSDAMSKVQKSLGALGSGAEDDQASMQEAMRQAREAQEQLTKLVTPGERVSRSVTEAIRAEKTEAEVTIKDETGRASVTKAPKGKGFGLRVQPSGAF